MIILGGLCSGGPEGMEMWPSRRCWHIIARHRDCQCVMMDLLTCSQILSIPCQDIVIFVLGAFLRKMPTIIVGFVMEGILIFVWSATSLKDIVCRTAMNWSRVRNRRIVGVYIKSGLMNNFVLTPLKACFWGCDSEVSRLLMKTEKMKSRRVK